MSDTTDCARIRPELGVYVLGAISPADRAAVDRHLAACRCCRDEVAELAGIPALLRRVPAAAAMQLSGDRPDVDVPEAGLLEGLLRRVAALRRRRRRRLLAAIAVLAAAVAAAGWVPHLLQPAAPPHQAALTWWAAAGEGSGPAARVGATVRYASQPWGTALEATVTGIPPGTSCQIWATTASGQLAAAGGWTVTRGAPHAWYPASVPFPAASLAGFDITAHGKVLVTISLHPGSGSAPASQS